jgi:hypothetical protein
LLGQESEENPKCTHRILNTELERISVESWINPEVWQQINRGYGLFQTYLPDSLLTVSGMSFSVSRDLNV